MTAAPPLSAPFEKLEDFVERFESAHRQNGDADLRQFLPEPRHPRYREILAELVRVDMEFNWERGRHKGLIDYRSRFPDLFADTDLVRDIAHEEMRLRRQAEDAKGSSELDSLAATVRHRANSIEGVARAYREFLRERPAGEPIDDWCATHESPDQAEMFRQFHRDDPDAARRLAEAVTSFPEPGTTFLEFELLEVLGQGAFGRVYLARQGELANRLVVLKIATDIFGEAQHLAQLQHTNIVPIYSMHRAGPFQAVCMPYLGSTTLAHVMEAFETRKALPLSGKDLVSTLHDRKSTARRSLSSRPSSRPKAAPSSTSETTHAPAAPPAGTPAAPPVALKTLEALSYVDAILWLGERLADGLAHAHEHQILHRDLKPANILFTDDGQPMLLDFNLSEDTKIRDNASAAMVGGTLPYMAPEHLEAFLYKTDKADERSDIFGVGVILFELLTGRTPFPIHRGAALAAVPRMIADRRKPPPRVRRWNPMVSPAVESIVRKCLEPDPARRYQSARQLQEDLQRQRENRTLKFARDPSVRERALKWARRHPRIMSTGSIAAMTVGLVVALGAGAIVWSKHVARLEAMDSFTGFKDDLHTAQFLLYGRTADRDQLQEGFRQCRTALDRYHVLDNAAWSETPNVQNLPANRREHLREDVGELLFLTARATAMSAQSGSEATANADSLKRALCYNDQAFACFSEDRVPRALWQQRSELYACLGDRAQADRLTQRANTTAMRTSQDHYLAAHLAAKAGNYRKALPLLEEATRLDPESFSAWFVKGNCHDSLWQNAESVASYNVCIALRPSCQLAWYNRGLAHLRANRFESARSDLDTALRLEPDFADAYMNRAQALEGLARYAEADADLTHAVELGSPETRLYFIRSSVRRKKGDSKGAKSDWEEGIRRRPTDELSWIARGLARLDHDPKGALDDFNEALKKNPISGAALQNKAHVLGECLHQDALAVETLNRAVSLYPDWVLPRSGRGVHLARLGKRKEALEDAREALRLDLDAKILYQVACIHALTSRKDRTDRFKAFELLSFALRNGFGWDYVEKDPDLDPIRKDPEFRKLIEAAQALRAGAARHGG